MIAHALSIKTLTYDEYSYSFSIHNKKALLNPNIIPAESTAAIGTVTNQADIIFLKQKSSKIR